MKSLLLRLDIRVRMVFFFAFALIMATAKSWISVAVGLFFVVFLSLISGISFRKLIKNLLLFEGLLVFLLLFLPFTYPGEVIFRLGLLGITREGVEEALLIFSRSSVILFGSIVFVSSTDLFTLIHALYRLRFPSKLVEIAFFTIRYISVVEREYKALRKAMKARAFKPGTNFHTYKSYAYLLGMLMVRSYDRAQRVYKAMLARGYRGNFPVYRSFKLGRIDIYFIPSATAFLAILSILAWR